MKLVFATLLGFLASAAGAAPQTGDYLIKFERDGRSVFRNTLFSSLPAQSKIQHLGMEGWYQIEVPRSKLKNVSINALRNMPGVAYVQPNFKIKLLENPQMAALRAKAAAMGTRADDDCPIPGMCGDNGTAAPSKDNPEIPAPSNPGSGSDPLFGEQWGMQDIGVASAWQKTRGDKNIVVAVLDTGIDYQHEDLVDNLWRNPGENGIDAQGRNKASNGVDDDGNGYVDDIIGWDFVSNDNKPYDLAMSGFELLFGGNPGHGTHCAGNVAARGLNGKGVSGVAPNVSIMTLRFLSEKGEGTTADAVKAIAYALRNGAHITSNSWGSEGEDPSEGAENLALREVIQASQDKGVLFVAAAGNGHSGVGYDNDTDAKPGVPASYDHDVIVSVAALDASNQLGSFSNWGARTVDIGAPGVKVYSTTVGSKYSDTVLDLFGQKVTWDGTSMATPHVAGAAALYLSKNPEASWRQVKEALLKSATPISSMTGKSVSNGKLNVERLLGM